MIKSAPFDALLSLYGSPRAILILSCAFQREKMGKGRKAEAKEPLTRFSPLFFFCTIDCTMICTNEKLVQIM